MKIKNLAIATALSACLFSGSVFASDPTPSPEQLSAIVDAANQVDVDWVLTGNKKEALQFAEVFDVDSDEVQMLKCSGEKWYQIPGEGIQGDINADQLGALDDIDPEKINLLFDSKPEAEEFVSELELDTMPEIDKQSCSDNDYYTISYVDCWEELDG